MTTPRVYKYKAFISYRHQDVKEAVAIQQFLEKFRLPVRLCRQYPDRPKRLGFVFRDATDLPPAELKLAIGKALASSEYLIVLCSRWTNQPNEDGKRWVSEEVKEFLSLDEQNKYRIIPVLLPREDVDVDTAYMPTAVVALDILATDMARKGRQGAYFDIVAAMLNLDPVDLKNRAEEEEARRLRNKRIGQGIAAALLAGSSFFAWDYFVPKHRYYAHYEEQNNIPVGIHEYTRKELKPLGEYYHFVEKRYRVRRVEHLNYAGEKVIPVPYPWGGDKTVVAEYEYNDKGEANKCTHMDEHGKQIVQRLFTSEGTIEFKKTRQKSGNVYQARSSAIGQLHTFSMEDIIMGATGHKNDIVAHAVTRKNGYIELALYMNGDGNPRTNEDGVWGCRYERDAQGRLMRLLFTDAEGKCMNGRKGIGGYTFQYGPDGFPSSVRYIDANGSDAQLFGVTEARYEWKNGIAVREACYDADGNLVINAECGYAEGRRKLSDSGAILEDSFYGVDGKPCVNLMGFASIRYEYDSRGNITAMTNLGVDGQPVPDEQEVCTMRMKYDDMNRVTEFSHFDAQDKPCRTTEGYSISRLFYDEHGNVERQEFRGVDGELCLDAMGQAVIETVHNDAGQVVEMQSLDTENKPVCNVIGFSRSVLEYEPNGEQRGESYFGPDGNPCSNDLGISSIKIRRGKFGSETWEEWRYYGVDDQPVVSKEGAAGMRVIYNEWGYLIRREFLGVDGKVTSPPNREAAAVYAYDSVGRRVEEGLEDATGVMRMKACYRTDGTIERREFSAMGQQPCCVIEYNAKGLEIKRSYFDADGKPCMGPDGFGTMEMCPDAEGNIRESTRYNPDGSIQTRTLHMTNGITEQQTYGKQGKLVKVFRIDANQKTKTLISYEPDSGEGRLRESNAQGRLARSIKVDETGNPIADENGVSGYRLEYDARGKRTLLMFVGADGKPVAKKEGYAGVRWEFDEQGNEKKRTLLGVDGQPLMKSE